MMINHEHVTSIRIATDKKSIAILDQRELPHRIVWEELRSCDDVIIAITQMHLRGAPLIGAAAAFGYYFALNESKSSDQLMEMESKLRESRPTAVNLNWAVDRMKTAVNNNKNNSLGPSDLAWHEANKIVAEDIELCKQIGQHGLPLLEAIYKKKNAPVNILMHCNPGWLACLDWGTATAPIYMAQQQGIPVHVWVDETRPRNQGAKLTAFEFEQQGIPYAVVCDNTGGHLMQHKMVDIVLVGTDRTSLDGDVANKIGTYLKALAAKDNQVPFWVALPSPSIDTKISDAFREIPIEIRSPREVTTMDGLSSHGFTEVQITPCIDKATNYGFDITPARLITGFITERGLCAANRMGLLGLFPELNQAK